jgi:cytochrome c6
MTFYLKIFIIFIFNFQINSLGKNLFNLNCSACHQNENNRIIPEKNLKKETLKAFGIDNKISLIYQITNGKNGMPGFGGQLKKNEIEEIVLYILK